MKYEQPEMEILLFEAKVETDLVTGSTHYEGSEGGTIDDQNGNWQ